MFCLQKQKKKDNINEVPKKSLSLIRKTLCGQEVTVLKEDGCSTNVILKSYFKRHQHMLNVKESQNCISQFMKDVTEQLEHVAVQTSLEMGDQKYKSNWAVLSLRYDILLGMPWRQKNNPNVDYKKGKSP